MTNLFLAGTLIISPHHPAQFPQALPQVWLSNSAKVDAQSLGSGIVLKAKEPGIIFGVGMQRQQTDPMRIYVVSDTNYDAIKKCPTLNIDTSKNPPEVKSIDTDILDKITNCGFTELSLSESLQQNHEQDFEWTERLLKTRGFKFSRPQWLESGQRKLNVYDTQANLNSRLNRLLGKLAPFYQIQAIDSPKPGRTLVFQLTLFEFSRIKARQLGVKFPNSFSVKSLEGDFAHKTISTNGKDGIEIGADFGESLGVGKILAQPQIRTKPGEKATFQSGGELPIKSSSAYHSETIWKSYGLIVNLEPDASVETGATEVSLGFKVELSEPDNSTALDGIPGMIVRRLESRFDLRTNENTVLTTMIQTRLGANRSGIAGLMHIPLLGRLLSDQSDNEQGSELWFSMRPSWEEISDKSSGDRTWL